MDLFLLTLLGSALVISAIDDLRRGKIPNMVTYPTMGLALGYHFISNGLSGLAFSAGGLGLGIGLFIIPYLMGGMGAGDVKLMGAAGAVLGAKGISIAAIMVILSGGIYGVILFLMYPKYLLSFLKRLWLTMKTLFLTCQFIPIPPEKDPNRPVLRYALPIALGTMCYVCLKLTGSYSFQDLLGIQVSI